MHRAYQLIEHDPKIVEHFFFTFPPFLIFYSGGGVQPLQKLPMVLVVLAKSSYCSVTAIWLNEPQVISACLPKLVKKKIRHYSSLMGTL